MQCSHFRSSFRLECNRDIWKHHINCLILSIQGQVLFIDWGGKNSYLTDLTQYWFSILNWHKASSAGPIHSRRIQRNLQKDREESLHPTSHDNRHMMRYFEWWILLANSTIQKHTTISQNMNELVCFMFNGPWSIYYGITVPIQFVAVSLWSDFSYGSYSM